MTEVLAEITEDGKVVQVLFPYDPALVHRIRQVPGRAFVSDADPKHWTVPADLTACRKLREQFGNRLRIGPRLRRWARAEVTAENALLSASMADSSALTALEAKLPTLYRAVVGGPAGSLGLKTDGKPSYQTADIRFMADSPSPLNGNQQGLGKTLELIGSVYESGLEVGNHLVITPSASIETTWEGELTRWQEDNADNVAIFPVTGTRAQREKILEEFLASEAETKWVVVNPAMIQFVRTDDVKAKMTVPAGSGNVSKACHCNLRKNLHFHYESGYPILMDISWNTITIDECHRNSIRNHRSITARSIGKLKLAPGGKKIAMSGTPMKKRGSDLWGILHWLQPTKFTSYWNFAENYFTITNNGFGQVVGDLRKDAEADFYRALTPYLLRRTKAECLPWLPPKQYVDVYVTMTPEQNRQYREMEATGATAMGNGEEVTTTSILAELMRLRQFANAYCKIDEEGIVKPTLKSAKLEALFAKLEEIGVMDKNESSTGQKVVIFSQFRSMIELVHSELVRKGVNTEVISGATTGKGQRKEIVDRFQTGDIQVLCIVTTAGGVSLTLDAADSAHFIDESFAPDEDEQAEDRIHRASRVHNVTIYRYRSRHSIDEEIVESSESKQSAHDRILDIRRSLVDKWKVNK